MLGFWFESNTAEAIVKMYSAAKAISSSKLELKQTSC